MFEEMGDMGGRMSLGDMIGTALGAAMGKTSFDDMSESMQRKLAESAKRAYKNASPEEREELVRGMPAGLRKMLGIKVSVLQKQPTHIHADMQLLGKDAQIKGLEEVVHGLSGYAEAAVKAGKKLKKNNKKLQRLLDEKSGEIANLQRRDAHQKNVVAGKDEALLQQSRDLRALRQRNDALERAVEDAIGKLAATKGLKKDEILEAISQLSETLGSVTVLADENQKTE